ncbi:MAG: hypothetical protein WKG01_32500 [Kofleriaceae bacterium]
MRRVALVLVAACGDPAPCDDVAGTCVELAVESATITEIDHLELDVLYGDTHGTTTTQLPGGGTVGLPLATAIVLALDEAGPIPVGVVGAGKLAAVVLGTGAGSTMVAGDEHVTIKLVLAPPRDCVEGGYYCGGDKVAGDSQTLYECNGAGVPRARGRCDLGCIVHTPDDQCQGAGGCVEGGDYCGGNKLDGDPRTLYTCTAGGGTNPRECADGCVVQPAGNDDRCR